MSGKLFVKRKSQSKLGKRRPAQPTSGRSKPEDKRARVVRCIRALPAGTVSSYGAIAEAAGWPGAARQVVRILREVPGLPWHRVVGSGGAIKLGGENGAEQRFRLRMEGVTFRGMRVDMAKHEHKFARRSAF
ncbi:MAG TPA: MGMT family protein [Terriglobales bacterium]|nr:MGMT family protein [Terriglobales bacterium]